MLEILLFILILITLSLLVIGMIRLTIQLDKESRRIKEEQDKWKNHHKGE